jgi:stalled ribosome alternative rescue factor ArfA
MWFDLESQGKPHGAANNSERVQIRQYEHERSHMKDEAITATDSPPLFQQLQLL